MAKAKLTTRAISTTTVTSDNLAKASQLTHNQIDSNFINLRDATFGVVADDSATIQIGMDSNLYIQGGDNVTTSTDSAGVVTINATSDVTASSSTTFTNKTIDVDNNTVSNIEVDNLKSGVLDTDLASVSGSDDTLASAKAIKAYVDTQDAATGIGDLTAVGSTLISPSNANITLDPSGTGTIELNANTNVTGNLTTSGSLITDGIQILDNNILASRTNDDLVLQTNNTGDIHLDNATIVAGPNSASGLNNTTITGGTNNSISIVGGSSGGTIKAMPGAGNGTGETGDIYLLNGANSGSIYVGNGSGAGTITSNGAQNLNLRTNNGTNSGSIGIVDGVNGDIDITTNGTGNITLSPGTTGESGGKATIMGMEFTDLRNDPSGIWLNIPMTADGSTSQDVSFMMNSGRPELYFNNAGSAVTDYAAVRVATGNLRLKADGANSSTGHIQLDAAGDITLAASGAGTVELQAGTVELQADTNVTGDLTTSAISLVDNKISASRSNDDLNLAAAGTGDVVLGNFRFDIDQSVGAGQDNYVLTYDHSGGKISLEASAGGGVSLSGSTDNTVATVTGSNALAGEANLTFDGSTLAVTGAITATTNISTDAIQLVDNVLSSSRSNDNFYITTQGSGDLILQGGDDVRLQPTDDVMLEPGDDIHMFTTGSGKDIKFWNVNSSKLLWYGNYAATWEIIKAEDGVDQWNESGTNAYPDTGDDLWTVNVHGGNGTGTGDYAQGGKLLFEAGADWSGSSRSTTFEIQLAQTGSTSLTTPFKINATGNVDLTGSLTAGTSIENDAIRITDNTILGLRSNDNITITPSGTGSVAIAKAAITGGTVTGITDITVADGGTGASSLTDNSVLTGTGTSPITAEGNLTFNGSTLGVTGAATISTTLGVTGASTLDGVTITDNTISSNASNANLEINANGSGTVNLENLKVGTSGATVTTILDEDAMGSDSATSLATQQSIKAYVDSKGTTALTGSTNNTITTVTGANAIQGEANLTFDGSTLGVTGAITATTNITATGTIGNDAVSITDNVITTSRSNDNLQIFANGTGFVEIGDFLSTYSTNARTHYGVNQTYNNTSLATADMDSSAERLYANGTYMNLKCVADSDESTSHARFRNPNGVTLDLNGTNLTNTGMWAGPVASWAEVNVVNSAGSSNTGTIGNATLFGGEGYLYGATSNFTNNNFRGVAIDCWVSASSGETIVVDNAYGFDYEGTFAEGSGGTETITSETAFYARFGNGASKYLLNTNTDTAESNVGTLFKYREKISPLTSSSTITVNCANAPIHTVTLAVNTGFVITNLGTGQTVTIICTQDGTGSRTATFGTDGSTAVKFAGGTPALSTAANAIDVITIVNDGSNYLGNIAKAYAA